MTVAASLPETTGNRFIDTTHAALTRQIEDLLHDCDAGMPRERLVPRFQAFVDEMRVHFGLEEVIIRGAGYADWTDHARKHEALGTQIARLVEYVNGCDVSGEFLRTVAGTLDAVLGQHEILHDRDFADHVRRESALPDTEDLIVWGVEFEVGIPSIDDQHRDLVALVNRLYRITRQPYEHGEAMDALGAIADHAAAHFRMEEGVLHRMDATRFVQHHGHHNALLAQLERIRRMCAEGRLDIADVVRDYLRFWLIDHIRYADRPVLLAAAASYAQSGRAKG